MAWEDPQWGGGRKGGNGGPPDLDEMLRRASQRLSAVLSGGRGGGGSGDPGPARGLGILGTILVVGALLAWLASGFYIVDAANRGVVQRFGEYVETSQPGPHWHVPWPVDQVTVVNVDQMRTITIGYRDNVRNKIPKESLMLTDDENIVDMQFAVQYNVKDVVEYLFNVQDPDYVMGQVAESSIREIVGRSAMDYVLYEGREDVAARAQARMQELMDRYGAGIAVLKVTMQNAQPPEQVQAAFDDAVKAGQDRERQKNEGQAYANSVIPQARGTASRLAAEAEGYRARVVADAQGDVARFELVLPEYLKAPEVTRERMYLDTMQQVLSSTSKVVVDVKGGDSLLYLPLDKLMQRAAPGTAAAVTHATEPAGGDASSASTSRSRDALRSRDREVRP